MNRRSFLQALLAVPALTLALGKSPEAKLCKCGKPMPAHQRPITDEEFAERYLRPAAKAMADAEDARIAKMFAANDWLVSQVHRRYDETFIASGGQGYVVKVRTPTRYGTLEGMGMGFSGLEE